MASRSNSGIVTFPTPTGAWSDPTHFAIHEHATNWEPVFVGALSNNPDAPATNDVVQFAAGDLSIQIDAAHGFNDAFLSVLLLVLSAFAGHVSLHTGTPTSSNELSGNGYARATVTMVAD